MFVQSHTAPTEEDGPQLLFGLVVPATPELISPVRRFVAASLRRLHFDEDLTWRMELASHELLDNASKYGPRCPVYLRVTRETFRGGSAVKLTLDNTSDATNIGRLEEMMTAMGHARDPMGYYLDLLKREDVRKSFGLGLARVRAEGDLELDVAVDGDHVAISARAAIVGEAS